ncbi:LysR substrate-binding domain-containing protein [Saccharopolyspora dendranthemae]|uniref:DNA-binding transcriptional LysR family regulator n=1 Tax=Saccharopolyspora dendranthemae TaxID=1181886 RepID=A0A561VB85_9PSEU|nr:LysR substrate-binding domain-containing protein [Saccharopolyspora dendranthemae]TWG08879.1 DNA-binding transcriptional LysR family regulator [Saccharopolyspora dendranthemae]
MSAVLDVVALRSLVAVADCGGFHRAAAALYLTQSAISQHLRKLERVTDRKLVVREGRQARFTAEGELLLAEARRILDVHDDAIRRLGAEGRGTLVFGSTEHAADRFLPELASGLRAAFPAREIRFRLDRTARLVDSVDGGSVDIALLIDDTVGARSIDAGRFRLEWFSAPDWQPPHEDRPLPLVVFDQPCVLRRHAIDAMDALGRAPDLVCEAADLSGVLAATRAGLGVTLLPSTRSRPVGLVERRDLPCLEPAQLRVRVRPGLPMEIAEHAACVVRDVLAEVA